MKLSEVDDIIDEKITQKKKLRNIEVYQIMGFNNATNFYNNHVCNISTIINSNNLETITLSLVAGTLVIYEGVLKKHYLNKEIKELNLIRKNLLRYNEYQNANKEFVNDDIDKKCDLVHDKPKVLRKNIKFYD